MAIASWAAARSIPYTPTWITLDDYDNRPRVFWSYVAAALRNGAGIAVPRILPGPGQRRHRSRLPAAPRFGAGRTGSARNDGPRRPPSAHAFRPSSMGSPTLLRNARPGLHLVVAAQVGSAPAAAAVPAHRRAGPRSGPTTWPSAWRNLAHCSRITASGCPPPLWNASPNRPRAGRRDLRLAALSHARAVPIQGGSSPNWMLRTMASPVTWWTRFSSNQPESVRDMLLRTSILDCVNAELASVLADDPKAADALPALARANAFVLPIGGGWYRYHSLFGELATSQAAPRCHRRATARLVPACGPVVPAPRRAIERGSALRGRNR